ncbi:MAG TPA: glycosyltransferase [Phycisphaerae bacterium]|nr:glycosyltransferase [Phycisphaerae bacterium]
MAILSTTLCYPHADAPTQGIFVQRRLRAISEIMPVRVVAPVPWFPGLVGAPSENIVRTELPPVMRPRMFYFPRVFKSLDAHWYAQALARGIDEVRRETPIDLIDAHFEWPDGVGAWRVARKLGLLFVCTLRGKLVSQIANASKRRQIIEMLRGADGLIAVSQSLADLACQVAGKTLDVRVIPNGVDAEVFHCYGDAPDATAVSPVARRELGWYPGVKYVVSVGHLQALKGFDRLVAMWPRVRQVFGDARLVLVGGAAGEPAYERRIREQIETSGMPTGAITLAGRVPPETVAQMLNAADLFVLATRSEGWCNAIAEALACGCPVVATDVGGNREVLNDWGLGWVVPLDNEEAFFERVCQGLREPRDRRRIAEIGGRRSWQQVARECVDVFQEVLGEKQKSQKVKTST